MRFAATKIEKLLGVPTAGNIKPGQFYLIEDSSGLVEFYLSDSKGVLHLLNEGGIGNTSTAEIPTGTINGSNDTFTLLHTPAAGAVKLYLNGLRLLSPGDYTVSGDTITMINIPFPGDILIVDYTYN